MLFDLFKFVDEGHMVGIDFLFLLGMKLFNLFVDVLEGNSDHPFGGG